jgi:hypothetical protein
MRELLVRGKNTIDLEVINPRVRSVEESPVKSDFIFYFLPFPESMHMEVGFML